MAVYPPSATPEPGSVTLVVSAARARLVLSGELDLVLKADLLDAVREAMHHEWPVDVDVRDVTFMDSSVIATLTRLVQGARHRPTLIGPSPAVRFLLDVTQIGELLDIVDEGRDLSAAPDLERTSPGPSSVSPLQQTPDHTRPHPLRTDLL